MEQHLHRLVKRIHASMDKLPDEEEDPGVYDAQEAERALQTNSNVDILKRAEFLRRENSLLREKLDEAKEARKKYITAINRFNSEVTDYIERIGRLFILQTQLPFEKELAQNEELRTQLIQQREETALAQAN